VRELRGILSLPAFGFACVLLSSLGKPHPRWADASFHAGDPSEKWHSRAAKTHTSSSHPNHSPHSLSHSTSQSSSSSSGSLSGGQPPNKRRHTSPHPNGPELVEDEPRLIGRGHHGGRNILSTLLTPIKTETLNDSSSLSSLSSSSAAGGGTAGGGNSGLYRFSPEPSGPQSPGGGRYAGASESPPSAYPLSGSDDGHMGRYGPSPPPTGSSASHCGCLTTASESPQLTHALLALADKVSHTMGMMKNVGVGHAYGCGLYRCLSDLSRMLDVDGGHGQTLSPTGSSTGPGGPGHGPYESTTPTESELMSPLSAGPASGHHGFPPPPHPNHSHAGHNTHSSHHHTSHNHHPHSPHSSRYDSSRYDSQRDPYSPVSVSHSHSHSSSHSHHGMNGSSASDGSISPGEWTTLTSTGGSGSVNGASSLGGGVAIVTSNGAPGSMSGSMSMPGPGGGYGGGGGGYFPMQVSPTGAGPGGMGHGHGHGLGSGHGGHGGHGGMFGVNVIS
jgi:hypothetical protein